MNDNLPAGVTQDMIDELQIDHFLEQEVGCPECGADTPDDRECLSCVTAYEVKSTRIKRKRNKQHRQTEEDINF